MSPAASSAHGHASGKVILLGEHAVVYGAPGIAAGIERGARATASPSVGASILELGGKTVRADDEADDLGRAFGALLRAAPLAPACAGGVRVEASAELAPGGGLGCSAALGVAIARAVDGLGDAPPQQALARADAWERVFHGNPSGIDTAAAFSGTFLHFTKTEGTRPIACPDDLYLAIGHSGSSASTKEMVEGVARIKARKPEQIEQFLSAVTSLVKNAELALSAGDVKAVGQLLDLNQMLLAGLLLSTERIEEMCRIARAEGALGAKLTGSGGGGSVIALATCSQGGGEGAAERIVDAWKRAGYSAFATRVRGASRLEEERDSR